MTLLEVRDLHKQFGRGPHAVDGVSFTVERGETLAIVGESGCGKSTLARTVLGLLPPTSGQIVYDGADLTELSEVERRPWRRRMQLVFQDPGASLNPRFTVQQTLEEPFWIHGLLDRASVPLATRIGELLSQVGLGTEHRARFPHELSGGQKQRVAIARALALHPEFLVLDEPTSALDVSVQAQILNLLADLQQQMHLTYLFISHNLAVVRHLADRCGVMYRGRLVELGDTSRVLDIPEHEYTQALVRSIPSGQPRWR